MIEKTVYKCDACGSNFEKPNSIGEYTSEIRFDIISAKNNGFGYKTRRLEPFGGYRELCPICTKKIISLLKEIGFKKVYWGMDEEKL